MVAPPDVGRCSPGVAACNRRWRRVFTAILHITTDLTMTTRGGVFRYYYAFNYRHRGDYRIRWCAFPCYELVLFPLPTPAARFCR